MDGMEFEISFTDLTMLEANGEYKTVQEIMSRPYKISGGIMVEAHKDWVIKSDVTIRHVLGFSIIQCDFYENKRVIITDFKSSTKDIYTPDIRCLTAWTQSYGWDTPEPLSLVIESWKDFWKMQWETYIINSKDMEKQFGERSPLIFGKEEDDEDDDFVDLNFDDDGDIDKYRGNKLS